MRSLARQIKFTIFINRIRHLTEESKIYVNRKHVFQSSLIIKENLLTGLKDHRELSVTQY
eukprot:snap_masked-scaffold_33-processed-gene-1.21-mRNA-1 protein AED:1.00 eAED:1.00 QI:0/0/0/0/1/1/2/0/59